MINAVWPAITVTSAGSGVVQSSTSRNVTKWTPVGSADNADNACSSPKISSMPSSCQPEPESMSGMSGAVFFRRRTNRRLLNTKRLVLSSGGRL